MKPLPPPFSVALSGSLLDEIPEPCRELVGGLITSASHPDPVFRELLAPHLAELIDQVRLWSHGELIYKSTEVWRTAYQQVLAAPEITEYRSVAWVKTEDYWQDLPGQHAMQFNYSLLDRGVRIERMLILGWNLWPPEWSLPLASIRDWIDEQHYRGVEIRLVREADLLAEPRLLGDFGIYGERATGRQELDDACRTICFTLSFDSAAVKIAREHWARLALFAVPYGERLDRGLKVV
jgi:hypothetical protein